MSRIVSIALLFFLLLFPSLSIEGAKSGLLLWFNVVLPTLAPFIICTQTVVLMGGTELLVRPFFPALHRLFGLSVPGAYVLLCGLLCGYPLGAKMCADFLESGKISGTEADYLLSFCNHPSPMFLLGFVMGQLKGAVHPAYVLACLYLPLFPLAALSRRCYRFRPAREACASGRDTARLSACQVTAPAEALSLESVLLSTAETMVVIGGYLMLFSILAVWIRQICFLPPTVTACLSGVAEITTGVNQICAAFPPKSAVLPVIAVVAFGGFSGIFQTKSVIKNAGLSIRHYLFWKIIHTCLACLTAILLSALLPLR